MGIGVVQAKIDKSVVYMLCWVRWPSDDVAVQAAVK